MKIVMVPLEKLELDPDNVRLHGNRNVDAIKRSLQEFGQHAPLVVNKDQVVIVGNGRLMAMRELEWLETAVHYVDLDKDKARALAIVDNRTAELASWDDVALASQLDALPDPELAGFSEAEVKRLLKKVEPPQDKARTWKAVVRCCPSCGHEWEE